MPPTFATLTKFDPHHRGDFDFGLLFFTADTLDGWAWRSDFYGQYGTEEWGYYGSAMIASFEPDGPGSLGGLGNLEGGAYHSSPSGPGLLVLRAGLQLPTAASGLNFLGNAQTIHQRLVDFPTVFPDTVTARGSASIIGTSGSLQYRIDGGLDFLLPVGDDGFDDPELIVNASAGVGSRFGNMFISGELVNIAVITEDADDLGDRFLHTMSFQIKHLGPWVHTSFTFTTPLDSDTRGEVFNFVFGVELVKMP